MSRNWEERNGAWPRNETAKLIYQREHGAAILSQSQRGYTGLAAIEGPNLPCDLPTHSLDGQLDTAVSREP